MRFELTRAFRLTDLQSAVTRHLNRSPINLEEGEGFEPSKLLHFLVFKTSAINQTRPPFQIGGSGEIRTLGGVTLSTLAV